MKLLEPSSVLCKQAEIQSKSLFWLRFRIPTRPNMFLRCSYFGGPRRLTNGVYHDSTHNRRQEWRTAYADASGPLQPFG